MRSFTISTILLLTLSSTAQAHNHDRSEESYPKKNSTQHAGFIEDCMKKYGLSKQECLELLSRSNSTPKQNEEAADSAS